MSLIQSAKLNGRDPYAYIKYVLLRLATHLASQVGDLLPHRWQPASSDHLRAVCATRQGVFTMRLPSIAELMISAGSVRSLAVLHMVAWVRARASAPHVTTFKRRRIAWWYR